VLNILTNKHKILTKTPINKGELESIDIMEINAIGFIQMLAFIVKRQTDDRITQVFFFDA